MSSIDKLTLEAQNTLLRVAARSIAHGLNHGISLPVTTDEKDARLKILGATFVTLNINQQLRGCLGSLQAYRPLIEDVAANAFAAAFRDPRFERLTESEYPLVEIHISVLSTPEPMTFSDEESLITQLRPNQDGLILSEGTRKSTFLPSVWSNLSVPKEFLIALKRKAGLPSNYWSNSLKASRYSTQIFGCLIKDLGLTEQR